MEKMNDTPLWGGAGIPGSLRIGVGTLLGYRSVHNTGWSFQHMESIIVTSGMRPTFENSCQ